MYTNCVCCGKEFEKKGLKKYCSKECRTATYNLSYRAGTKWEASAPPGTVGAGHELLTCVDLMYKGYEVFRAESPCSSCDLIALRNGEALKIEVRTGQRRKDGQYGYDAGKPERYDVLAVVLHNGEIFYLDPQNQPIKV